MQRRHLIALGLTAIAPLPARAAVPTSGRLAFRAFRNDSPLGTHVVTFATSGPTLTVTTAIDYQVKLGPITLFRYSLRSTETWRDNTLLSVRAETNDDGKADFMRADRAGNIWCSSASVLGYAGVTVWNPAGQLIGRIRLPEPCANLCFAGPKRDHLFMTATQSIYMLRVNIQGAAPG